MAESMRVLKKKLRNAKKKHKQAKLNVKNIDEELTRLRGLRDELEKVTLKNGGIVVKTDKTLDWVNGIWIVAKREKNNILLYKFYEFIREVTNFKKFQIDLPEGAPLIGEDGLEVTFNKGNMLQVIYRPDIKPGMVGWHFSNVGPNGPEGQLQLELALHRLGMGPMPCADPKSFLIVDGTFRKVN